LTHVNDLAAFSTSSGLWQKAGPGTGNLGGGTMDALAETNELPDSAETSRAAAGWPPSDPTGIDAYAPAEIAERVEKAGIGKARLSALSLVVLAILAGAFTAFGAMLYTLVMTGSGLGFGPGRLIGGIAFSLGLILVIVGGAELFTGNALIVMAAASRRVSIMALLRNWGIVYVGNFAGALGAAVLVYLSGTLALDAGAMGETARGIARAKLALSADQAFFRGVLCNALVCLAVWLCFSARDVAGKVLAIVWPISAFVALGFEHSVANMYLIPIGMLAGAAFDLGGFAHNLFWVTLGNIVPDHRGS
jgi:formate/nitrite transporter